MFSKRYKSDVSGSRFLENNRKIWRYQREVIKICKSKDRQYNGQMKNDKRTSNDLHDTTHKRLNNTNPPQKTRDELHKGKHVLLH